MLIQNGTLFCEDGTFRALDLEIQGDKIAAIGPGIKAGGQEVLDATGCYVVPGLVDIHIHGAMGADFSDGEEASIQTMARYLLSQGVTSFLGTSMALPEERLSHIFRTARPLVGRVSPGMAVLRGINMEGPFFNLEKRGAQNPEYIIPPDAEMFRRLNADSGESIRTVAVAPESPGGLEFIEEVSKICSVSLAHSSAGYQIARQAFERGANHVTHLFNGMSPFHHRDPGIVGAAVGTDAYVELICDGVHVHPAVVQAVFQLFGEDRVCLVSDAMRACGMPDGQYDLGGQTVTVAGGCATIASGSLAGSITVLTDCLRRAVTFGIPLEAALKAATINPARSVGLDHVVGSLSTGKQADLLVLQKDLSLKHVILAGRVQ
ncbi:MAG TPA: N-acetylglucosamine-6-phosphate deacetylase [Clostridiales bacterium]|nr:N-acetylglucosamine-6-phosphate deacetylase [Clostridiales bacterium]